MLVLTDCMSELRIKHMIISVFLFRALNIHIYMKSDEQELILLMLLESITWKFIKRYYKQL